MTFGLSELEGILETTVQFFHLIAEKAELSGVK